MGDGFQARRMRSVRGRCGFRHRRSGLSHRAGRIMSRVKVDGAQCPNDLARSRWRGISILLWRCRGSMRQDGSRRLVEGRDGGAGDGPARGRTRLILGHCAARRQARGGPAPGPGVGMPPVVRRAVPGHIPGRGTARRARRTSLFRSISKPSSDAMDVAAGGLWTASSEWAVAGRDIVTEVIGSRILHVTALGGGVLASSRRVALRTSRQRAPRRSVALREQRLGVRPHQLIR